MILCFNAKQKRDGFLLSLRYTASIVDDHDGKKRPEVIFCYNAIEGGVDTADEMLRCYSTKAPFRPGMSNLRPTQYLDAAHYRLINKAFFSKFIK